ncbi:glycosyltransferase [Micromonospora sediminicola]|uniref:glycosyltransferase n=1 Tax=Micromonospora sediminicola TaxID=946078 RepID=UPI0033DB14AA
MSRPDADPPSPRQDAPALRIVILVKTNEGGIWIVQPARAMAERGHEVVVVLPPGDGKLTRRLAEHGIRTVDSPFSFRFRPDLTTLRGLWQLRRLLRRLRPDVLNYHLYAATLAGRLASLGLPLTRAHTVVGPLFLESPLIRRVERRLWRLDDVIVCGTAYTSRCYAALGVPTPRRPVVTCGIDTSRLSPVPAEDHEPVVDARAVERARREQRAKARADLGVAEDVLLVLMVAYVYPAKRLVARGRPIKGHDVLLEAWRRFRTAAPQAHLMLVGGGLGDEAQRLRRDLIDRYGVADDPTVTWFDSVDDVRLHYQAADLSVSPSLSEGHGASVEASAMAVPSVVSDAGGLPETVTGDSGWVVPRDDPSALAAALSAAYAEFSAGTLASRGIRARELAVRHFDHRPAAREVVSILERAAAARRGRVGEPTRTGVTR